jgi:hypothetical protein
MRRSQEQGAILLILLSSLATLLVIVGAITTIGFLTLTKAELRSAADTAAFAGASKLCSSRECYDAAYAATLFALRKQYARSDNGAQQQLTFDPDPLEPSPWHIPDTTNPKLTIEVSLGMWREEDGFEPFTQGSDDLPSWQEQHPGVPRYMAANAVRVTLTRPVQFIRGLRGSYSISVSSTMLAQKLESSQMTAPLALPVCALLDSYGESSVGSVCAADRIFTKSDRYCPPDTNCSVSNPDPCCNAVPSFSWDPYEGDATFVSTSDTRQSCGVAPGTSSGFSCTYANDIRCGWHSKRYLQPGDHFGVYGLPGNGSSSPSESDIINAFASKGVTANVGDLFTIMNEGLTTPAAEDAIWETIDSAGIVGGSIDNPAYSTTPLSGTTAPSSDNGQADTSELFHFNPYGESSCLDFDTERSRCRRGSLCCTGSNCPELTTAAVSLGASKDAIAPIQGSYTNYGVCHSRRFGPQPITQGGEPKHLPVGVGPQGERTVWTTTIPIIADFSAQAQPCASVADGHGSFQDPYNVQGGRESQWRIIGFVRADVFDVDIGNPAPSYPTTNILSQMSSLTPIISGLGGLAWPYGWAPGSSQQPDQPWGFVAPCNLTRARARCDTNFFPGALEPYGSSGEIRAPVLVE